MKKLLFISRFSTLKLTIPTFLFIVLFIGKWGLFAQDTSSYNHSTNKQKLTFGLYIGAIQANQYTANMYNGYGFDVNGNQNSFGSSWMLQKIVYEYGGYLTGQSQDQIAEQLDVNYHSWAFDESDMPKNMNYAPGFNVGTNFRYSVDEKNAILININVAKIIARGNFTIQTPQPANSTSINNTKFQTFSIVGEEQRLLLMFGYQGLLGDNDGIINLLIEGGLNATLAKFSQNFVVINNLNINLLSYFNSQYNTSGVPIKNPIGIGLGYFGGAGINIKTKTKYSAQLVYNLSMEKINIGIFPVYKPQHYLGLRFYYNF